MKRLITLPLFSAIAALGLLSAGCASTGSGHQHGSGTTKAAEPAKTGAACAKCTCAKFEPRVEDANSCRMCWHTKAEHSR